MDNDTPAPVASPAPPDRQYLLERVGEAAVVQVYADGFSGLSLREKTLVWHLYRAAIAGRDIFYDQRYAHNLEMRDLLEAILTHAAEVDPVALEEIQRYTKLFWINTGGYNNLTARKFVLTCSPERFAAAVHAAARSGARISTRPGESLDGFLDHPLGMPAGECRSPVGPLSADEREKLRKIVTEARAAADAVPHAMAGAAD